MKDQFDNNLAKKIRDTLLQHEEPYVAGSWENFNKKRNRPKGLILKISLGLAAVLVFAMVSAPFVVEKLQQTTSPDTEIAAKNDGSDQSRVDSKTYKTKNLEEGMAEKSVTLSTDKNDNIDIAKKLPSSDFVITRNEIKVSKSNVNDKNLIPAAQNDPAVPVYRAHDDAREQEIVPVEKEYLAEVDTMALRGSEKQLLTETENKPIRLYKDSVMNELFVNPALATIDEEEKRRDIKWGVMFSSGMNYNNAQTNSSLNLGGGVTTEIPLTKKLELFAGVAVARQSVLVDQSGGSNMLLLSGRQLLKSTANLIWLDVPVNLQYSISSNESNNLYVSAGLSSGTYLKEEYEQLYQVQELALETTMLASGEFKQVANRVVTDETEIESENSSNAFGLGRILNLAFGMEYNIQKNMGIVLEPYFKYPLGELTSRDMRYSTGGINLRINYTGRK